MILNSRTKSSVELICANLDRRYTIWTIYMNTYVCWFNGSMWHPSLRWGGGTGEDWWLLVIGGSCGCGGVVVCGFSFKSFEERNRDIQIWIRNLILKMHALLSPDIPFPTVRPTHPTGAWRLYNSGMALSGSAAYILISKVGIQPF